MAARTTQQPEAPEQLEEEENQVTRPSDLGFGSREIEVDPIQPITDNQVDESGYVEVRMAVTIEEFTYGNPHIHHRLEEGKRYRMPVNIARYLQSLGKLSNIA